jgi:hypothetical protein
MKYFLFIHLIIFASCYSKKPEKTGMEGKTLPPFTLLLPDSVTKFDTKNIPKLNPIVLVLFGPNCPYSKLQAEEIISNINGLKDIQFYFFTNSPFVQMKQFYLKYNLSKYPNITIGIDPQDFYGQYIGAKGVPYVSIYNKNKILIKAFSGRVKANQIKEIVEN